jgi:hypothetical protein
MKHLPLMIMNCVPHRLQRYDSCGDWYDLNGVTHFTISQMDIDKEMETLLHELLEWHLCQKAGITAAMVDKWDFAHPDSDDPGSLKGCPYKKQHEAAMKLSKLAVKLMGHNWEQYNKEYNEIADKMSALRS